MTRRWPFPDAGGRASVLPPRVFEERARFEAVIRLLRVIKLR